MSKHILLQTGIRRLGSKEKGFFYRYPDSNQTVREGRVLKRIEKLKVPPAWKGARIARSPSSKVQAVGYDSAGRLQYLYSEHYREGKEREKFDRILRFYEVLPAMRRITSEHLRRKHLDREKVLACMTRLMNAAYFRVGNERYAGMVPGELDDLGPEERNRVYKMLGLGVTVRPSGVLEVSGSFDGEVELSKQNPTRASGARSSPRPSPTRGSGGWWRSAGISPATRSSSTSTTPAASAT